jgi:sugar O-acyltransferase (sialic acid O-acetyltransferase NeuD family)
MKKVIVIGSGGHAKVIIDIINEMGCYSIIGITSTSLIKGDLFVGYEVLGDDNALTNYRNDSQISVAMGLGGYTNNDLRKKVYNNIKKLGYNFINVIHPNSILSKTIKLGEGVTIFPGVIINSYANIGNNVIIATGSTIDHETNIGDHVLISAGVTIGAYTEIEDEVLLALGSKVISGLKIGKKSLIAAGAMLVSSTNENSKMFGIPAKEKKETL